MSAEPSPEELAADGDQQREAEASRAKLTLAEVMVLVAKLQALQHEAATLEETLTATKKASHELSDVVLPRALTDLGLTGLALAGGGQLVTEPVLSLTVNDENREKVHAWLREIGSADLIKNVVAAEFGKGEDSEAQKLLRLLATLRQAGGLKCGNVEQQERVNHQTLLAFVRRRLKASEPVPAADLKLYQAQRVVIVPAKKEL